jgi:DNA-directed RNA polymerase subunit RPC12/RpoP
VQSQSASPDGGVSLEKVPLEKGMELIDKERPPRFEGTDKTLYFHVTCLNTRKPWLMRYNRLPGQNGWMARDAVKLPDDFFGDGAMKAPPVDSDLLGGVVRCPYCEAAGWGKCGFCGHLFCVDPASGLKEVVCPVCESHLTMAEDDDPFSVDGSRG